MLVEKLRLRPSHVHNLRLKKAYVQIKNTGLAYMGPPGNRELTNLRGIVYAFTMRQSTGDKEIDAPPPLRDRFGGRLLVSENGNS